MPQHLSQSVNVIGGHAKAVAAVLDEVVRSARCGRRNERPADQRRLVQHHPPRIGSRWHRHDVCRRVQRRQLVALDMAEEADVRAGERAQTRLLRPRSREDHIHIETVSGTKEDVDPLLRCEPTDRED